MLGCKENMSVSSIYRKVDDLIAFQNAVESCCSWNVISISLKRGCTWKYQNNPEKIWLYLLYFQMSEHRNSDSKRWKPQEASARLATRLNSSSYSLCLRHKYKEKYKCNHKDKYKCNRQDYYRVKAQIQKQNNDTHHQQHKQSMLLFLELCFLSSIGLQKQLLYKKYYLVFQSILCQGIHCRNMLVPGKNEIVTFNWTENSISIKQKKLHYEKAWVREFIILQQKIIR